MNTSIKIINTIITIIEETLYMFLYITIQVWKNRVLITAMIFMTIMWFYALWVYGMKTNGFY